MSTRILILKDGVITPSRSFNDITAINESLGIITALALKANLTSPALTGTPTTPTATVGSNTTQIANTAFVSTAISNLVNSAPGALDTLNELAAALGNDTNFSATITNSLALKAPLASPTFTGTVNGITAMMVGLGNVNNTSDLSKPISTATQTALNLKADLIDGKVPSSQLPAGSGGGSLTLGDTSTTAYRGDYGTIAYNHSQITSGNPHGVTASGVGLGNLVNSLQLVASNNLSDLVNRQTALNNISGAVTSGTYLRGNGTNILLSAIQASDIPTLNQNTTGTASNITGTLSISNGGTGATTQQTALNALVGNQTANRVLKSNGVNMLLAQVGLTTDVVDILPIANGGTGSSTQNFVDLSNDQLNIGGVKVFSNTTDSTSTTTGGTRCLGGLAVAKNISIGGRILQTINYTFKAGAAISQTLTTGAWTKIDLATESLDTNNQYTTSTSRLTAITTETWKLTLFITLQLATASRILISVWKNGAEVGGTSRLMDMVANAGDFGVTLTLQEFPLVASDYLEVYCYSSAAATVFGEANLIASFWTGKRID